MGESKASAHRTVGLGRRRRVRATGGIVGSKGMAREVRVSLIHPPTNLHGYKCPLFIGLNYHIIEFITMPLNYYSTFLEYSAASLLFAGQSRHTVSKQWASTSGRPTVAGLRPKGLAPRRRPSSPRRAAPLVGLRRAVGDTLRAPLAFAFRGALLPRRVPAGPGGDITSWFPPGPWPRSLRP